MKFNIVIISLIILLYGHSYNLTKRVISYTEYNNKIEVLMDNGNIYYLYK